MPFFVLIPDRQARDAVFIDKHPQASGVEIFEFEDGIPLTDRFVPGTNYLMSGDYPNARSLLSLVNNALGLTILSADLRAVLEQGNHQNIEFLPITILNHRDKVASEDYCIANVLSRIACIDEQRSVFKRSALDPNQIMSWQQLVLDERKIPADLDIFRILELPMSFIVNESVKNRIEATKDLTGLILKPIEEFTSLDL